MRKRLTAVAAALGLVLAASVGATAALSAPGDNSATTPYKSLYTSTSSTGSLDTEVAVLTLGTKFSSNVAGYVDSVEFYKPSGSTATTVNLWSATGTKLATGTAGSGTGWVVGRFQAPVHITAGTTYIASYTTPNRYQSLTNGFTSARTVGPLTVPANGGAFVYSSTAAPTNTSSNEYFVSPWFVPDSVTPYQDLYTSSSPTGSLNAQTQAVNLGVKFSSSVAGYIDTIEFYRPSVSTARTVTLWSATGTNLGTATAPAQASPGVSGWTQARFAAPVHISAGTTYVASYLTPSRFQSVPSGFTAARTVGAITVPASGGAYFYSATNTFPSNATTNEYLVSPWLVPDASGAPANQPPVAAFTSSCTALACSFNGSSSSDPDGTIASYSWNFGDGSAAGTGATPSHTYATGGTYTVTLTVTDNGGLTNSVSHTVSPSAANQSPVAAFTSSCSSLACSFDGSGSSDPDGTISSYAWTFGDGGTGSGATPSHTYASAGTYTVTLTVTDNSGGTNAVSHSVSPTSGGGGTGFPTAATTGVPAGTTLVSSVNNSGPGWTGDANGHVTIAANAVASGIDVKGKVAMGTGSTLKNSKVECVGEDSFCVGMNSNTTLQDVEIGGGANGTTYGYAAGVWTGDFDATANRNHIIRANIHSLTRAVQMDGQTTVQDSYFHDSVYDCAYHDTIPVAGNQQCGLHSSASFMSKGHGITYDHNTLQDGSSAVLFGQVYDNDGSSLGNVTINNNRIRATVEPNGFTSSFGVSIEYKHIDVPSSIRITNNTFDAGPWDIGQYRNDCPTGPDSCYTVSGNITVPAGSPINP